MSANKSDNSSETLSRLSRWFSMRRGSYNNYDLITLNSSSLSPSRNSFWERGNKDERLALDTTMTLLEELEEIGSTEVDNASSPIVQKRTRIFPLSLCPVPPEGLTSAELKKRYIISAILNSENSYILSMQRLVNDYKKPLVESNPPILNNSKVATLFQFIPEIIHCHLLLRKTMSDFIHNWDAEGKIGDAFLNTFSRVNVLEAYSGYINNFSNAMDLAKAETKRKSAFADFLHVKQISSHDRLSFFGLMVKPVQRIPQFILFLQDLLKYTSPDHADRMSLQMALTQMESLADSLNERKRESEQFQNYKTMLQQISGPFSSRFMSSDQRFKYLLREDNVIQLDFGPDGEIVKSKPRRILLANDKVICVSVAPKQSNDFGASEKLTLKWTCALVDIEIIDESMIKNISNRFGTSTKTKAGGNISSSSLNAHGEIETLANDLCNLMHDYNVMSRINELVSQLKNSYCEINSETTRNALNTIQSIIKKKDEEIAWMDSCCIQMVLKSKSGKDESVTFRTDNPEIKREWITELRLAKLALDTNNSPAWESFDREMNRTSLSMPLFLKLQPVYKSTQHQTEICCGCYYPVSMNFKHYKRSNADRHYIWICSIDGTNSHITILQHHPNQSNSLIEEYASLDMPNVIITAIEHTYGHILGSEEQEHVWCGLNDNQIKIFNAKSMNESPDELTSIFLHDTPTKILYHANSGNVFVSLKNGDLILIYKESGYWVFDRTEKVTLKSGKEITSIHSINNWIYASCGNSIYVLDASSGAQIIKQFEVCASENEIGFMQTSGVGLWVSLKRSCVLNLYHAETFKHLQDLNIAPHILRVTSSNSSTLSNNAKSSSIFITALQASKGLLWVGTNVGISCTIPLPRLEGVPLISGNVNISYHAHCGPVTFFLPLISSPTTTPSSFSLNSRPSFSKTNNIESNFLHSNAKEQADNMNIQNTVVLRKKSRCRENEARSDSIRKSKTLPRGFSGISAALMRSSSSSGSSQNGFDGGCDIFGMYSDLLYIKEDFACSNNIIASNNEETMTLNGFRRGNSDPDLAGIPFKVGTLDRRLKMKIGRPRSLDLSNWSVESRTSSVYTSSSESEDSTGLKFRSISRNSSSASSHKFNGGDLSEIKENDVHAITSTPNTKDRVHSEKVDINAGTMRSTKNKNSRNVKDGRRTLLMLMGGRGYVNWRNIFHSPVNSAQRSAEVSHKHSRSNSISTTNYKLLNSTDGNIIIWEKKI